MLEMRERTHTYDERVFREYMNLAISLPSKCKAANIMQNKWVEYFLFCPFIYSTNHCAYKNFWDGET